MATKQTYADQLKSPHWQRKRLEMLDAAKWTCGECGDKEKTLHVHHKKYVKGRKAWEYSNDELAVLCEDCHEQEHDERKVFDALLAAQWGDIPGDKIALGFLAGFLCPLHKELAEQAASVHHLPFFDLGFLVAALGPADIANAVRQKIAAGRLPSDLESLNCILETIVE